MFETVLVRSVAYIAMSTKYLCRHLEVWLTVRDIVMDGSTPRVEGARTDEQVLGDNPLTPLQQAHAPTSQQAANLESMPAVCQDTVEQQEAAVMASRLDYTDAEVMVEVVAASDFKPNMLNLTGKVATECTEFGVCSTWTRADHFQQADQLCTGHEYLST